MVLGIYGAGGLGREIYGFASWFQKEYRRWDEIVFVDDADPSQFEEDINVITFGKARKLYQPEEIEIVIGQGEPQLRKLLSERTEEAGYSLATLIHPNAAISKKTIIEPGAIINSDKVTISPGVVIKRNVLIQPFVAIGHDSVIGDNSVVSVFSAIAGNCHVGQNVYVAMHVAIRENVKVGNDCILGMGAIIARSIPDNHTAFSKTTRMVPHEPGTRVFG